MQKKYFITIEELCVKQNIDISFISSLQKIGLIEIITFKGIGFIEVKQLQQLERFIYLYYELDINFEGIDTITHLLQQIKHLQDEIVTIKNELRLYETNK
ncbi:MAG: hypothetical protein A2X12_01610 [Bacteroidetes bacterium GWE2_29_8]|nr:MAG: hypothetical protein A2X12_01610 [Bacteroidetes bacterium GWE2_29_8]